LSSLTPHLSLLASMVWLLKPPPWVLSWLRKGSVGLTLGAYVAAFISPGSFWPSGFVALTIPFFLILQLFLAIYWLFSQYLKASLHTLAVLLGLPFLYSTVQYSVNKVPDKNSFTVLSYNVRVFNAYDYLGGEKSLKTAQMINWLAQHPADIKCLQEFYYLPGSKVFNTLQRIAEAGKYQWVTVPSQQKDRQKPTFGAAIFSKLPIVKHGILPLGKQPHHKGLYADVLKNNDTIRIINVHLQSMSIDEENLFGSEGHTKQAQQERLWELFYRLKKGFIQRAKQVAILDEFIRQSPHPIILCGDLNDVPYSFTYTTLKQNLHNAFEAKGSGFGFTFRGKQLFFLRIDHQFFSPKRLSIQRFKTLQEIAFSDHYPIEGVYALEAIN